MAVSTCYTVESVIDAIINADSYINQAADTGMYEAVDAVIDAGLALEQSGISELHLEILYYRWGMGYSQQETADILSMKRDRVAQVEVRSRNKIQAVLDRWSAEND